MEPPNGLPFHSPLRNAMPPIAGGAATAMSLRALQPGGTAHGRLRESQGETGGKLEDTTDSIVVPNSQIGWLIKGCNRPLITRGK